MTVTAALLDLLATEHQAIYAYGVLGAQLDEQTRAIALASVTAHRASRDALQQRLRDRGVGTPGPEAAYDLAVANAPAAVLLAVRVETELGVRWRDLVAQTTDEGLRSLAVQGLSDCAVRATTWRTKAGVPPTVALPGLA